MALSDISCSYVSNVFLPTCLLAIILMVLPLSCQLRCCCCCYTPLLVSGVHVTLSFDVTTSEMQTELKSSTIVEICNSPMDQCRATMVAEAAASIPPTQMMMIRFIHLLLQTRDFQREGASRRRRRGFEYININNISISDSDFIPTVHNQINLFSLN